MLHYCGCVFCPATASSHMRTTAGFNVSNVVDVYNGTTGAWSTAQLSVARPYLAAASVGNVALFAGGSTGGALFWCKEHVWRSWGIHDVVLSVCERLSVSRYFLPLASTCCLIRSAAGNYSNVVDIYNGITGLWSTAQLSFARMRPATASVGNVALFAGGSTEGAVLCADYVYYYWLRGGVC